MPKVPEIVLTTIYTTSSPPPTPIIHTPPAASLSPRGDRAGQCKERGVARDSWDEEGKEARERATVFAKHINMGTAPFHNTPNHPDNSDPNQPDNSDAPCLLTVTATPY